MIEKTYPITEKLLKNTLALSLKLLDLLTIEAEHLKSNDNPTAISDVAFNKKQTVSQLDQHSKQLSQILATEKLQMSSTGMSDYFNKAEIVGLNTSKSTKLWKEILSISNQCQLLNEKNGASINLLSQHTQRSLHILKGKPQQTSTYGPDGSAYSEHYSHPLISV
jgi:flagella synthesis protein FlgN